MSIRSKVTNTLGPDSLQPVLRKSSLDPLYPDSTSDRIPIPPPGTWLMEDPLSTTANLAFNTGTWDTASGYLNLASPVSDTDYNVRHSYAINQAFDRHVVQAEIGIPNAFQSGTECHMDVGFNTTSWSNGNTYFSARSRGSNVRASWLRTKIAWTDGPTYAFADNTWYTMRMMWDVPSSTFTGYVNGAQITTFSYAQSESGMVPVLSLYRYGGTHSNLKFRNLKYWGGSTSDVPP